MADAKLGAKVPLETVKAESSGVVAAVTDVAGLLFPQSAMPRRKEPLNNTRASLHTVARQVVCRGVRGALIADSVDAHDH